MHDTKFSQAQSPPMIDPIYYTLWTFMTVAAEPGNAQKNDQTVPNSDTGRLYHYHHSVHTAHFHHWNHHWSDSSPLHFCVNKMER